MPRKSWQDLPEYQFVEDNPNPKFRPSVDKLTAKLREFSFLKGHPEAVEFIVNDLVHHYFVREAQRPAYLWHVISHAMFEFERLMPGFNWAKPIAARDQVNKAIELLEQAGWYEKAYELQADLDYYDAERAELSGSSSAGGALELPLGPAPAFSGEAPITVTELPLVSPGEAVVREMSQFPPVGLVGGAPSLETAPNLISSEELQERPKLTQIDLENKAMKKGVDQIIGDHMYNSHSMECGCGREMDTWEAWTKHLRIRIFNYMKNEFPPMTNVQPE